MDDRRVSILFGVCNLGPGVLALCMMTPRFVELVCFLMLLPSIKWRVFVLYFRSCLGVLGRDLWALVSLDGVTGRET